MDTARYTLDEAERELKRRDCAQGGHRPSIDVGTHGDELGTMLCDCTDVAWIPQRRQS